MESLYNNIYQVLNRATDYHFDAGLSWYDDARRFCTQVSQETNKPFISVCAVLAALSPRNKWERNKQDCLELCRNNHSHKFGTFGANVAKAKQVSTMTDYTAIVELLNGPKITAFFDNIFDINSQKVTVDVHMLMAAMGEKLSEEDRPNLTKSLYDKIEQIVLDISDKFKLRPYETQAIIWVTWRES